MSVKRCFYQDFLFEDMPVDEQDNPIVEIVRLPRETDVENGIVVSFDKMLKMDRREEWDELYSKVEGRDVYIKEDVPLQNTEMEPYKNFYLRSYSEVLLRHCSNLYVFEGCEDDIFQK